MRVTDLGKTVDKAKFEAIKSARELETKLTELYKITNGCGRFKVKEVTHNGGDYDAHFSRRTRRLKLKVRQRFLGGFYKETIARIRIRETPDRMEVEVKEGAGYKNLAARAAVLQGEEVATYLRQISDAIYVAKEAFEEKDEID